MCKWKDNTPWSRDGSSWKTNRCSACQFPAFSGTRGFIIEFTSTRHLSLLWLGWPSLRISTIFCMIRFNIIFKSVQRPLKWAPCCSISSQNPIRIFAILTSLDLIIYLYFIALILVSRMQSPCGLRVQTHIQRGGAERGGAASSLWFNSWKQIDRFVSKN